MDSRRRGAALLLAALLVGRLLDRFDLPFERDSTQSPLESTDATSETTIDSSQGGGSMDSSSAAPASTHPAIPSPRAAASPVVSPVSVNRATALELQRLPGVGPVLASRIVAERESGGPFAGPGDLRRVKGIGAATSARLAPHLRFD